MVVPELIIKAITILETARIDPTDKSIPPEIITTVNPNASKPLIDACLNTEIILYSVKKLGEAIPTKILMAINPKNGIFLRENLPNPTVIFLAYHCS